MIVRLKNIVDNILSYYTHIWKSKNTFNINFFIALKMKLQGFTPDQYILYDLKNNDINDYISEKERWYTRRINEQYTVILDDKLMFYEVFNKYINIPANLFYIKNNIIRDTNGKTLDFSKVIEIIEKQKTIFIKPIIGGGGRAVYKVHTENGQFFYNNKYISHEELFILITSSENSVANPQIIQSEFSKSFYKESVNTIRLVTVYHDDSNPIVTNAMHRFGTSKTGVVDNASSGGIFAKIDIETGIMYEAKNYQNETFIFHPDSQTRIKGRAIPNWEDIKNTCLKVAKEFFYIPYMAWDIVLVEDGIEIIEINASTGLTFIEMYGGQRNSKLGEFFDSKGCLK